MPFPFVLPTTSAFSFAAAFSCPSHPSLLRNASTYRGVVRDTLKRHKRLPPESQAANLGLVMSALQDYLPYLVAVADGLSGKNAVRVVPRQTSAQDPKQQTQGLEWRPVLVDPRIPGREAPRVKIPLAPGATIAGLSAEIAFALSALGHAYTLQARVALQPLYVVTSVVPVGSDQRLAAITAATKSLLAAAGVFLYAAMYTESSSASAVATPAPEISSAALRALSALALAEATLLAVLKDDPYPAVVAQDRNEHDREWMYKAPDIPKVRAHLFARLCLAASEHTAAAAAGSRGLSSAFLKYLDDLRHTSRAKACRFFAIDADLGGQTGMALAYIQGAMEGLDGPGGSGSGILRNGEGDGKKGSLISRLRKERSEKKEDRRIERGSGWGSDAGRFEEARVLAMLDAKWTKQNDTVNVQRVPPSAPLLAQMPSGRDIHVVKPMNAPTLDPTLLEAMRAPVDPLDELADEDNYGGGDSSEDEPAAPSGGSKVLSTYY